MIAMTLVLGASALAFGVATWLGLPAVPLLILSGVALGASGALPPGNLLQDVLLLGLSFLMFVAGSELNPSRAGTQFRVAVKVGLAQFFLIAVVGFAVATGLGLGAVQAVYMGLAVTASSTLVVLGILRQRQQFFEPFGRLVVGVLLLQDVLIIFFISALSRIDDGPLGVGLALAGISALVGLAWIWARWVAPFLLLRLHLDDEAQLVVILANLFLFLGLSQWIRQPLPAGAFLAGVSLSAFPIGGIVRGQMSSLFDFFLALFFVVLGALLLIPAASSLWLVVLLTLLVLVSTPLLVVLIVRGAGLSARTGIEGGLLLSQCSELSLVLALVGLGQGHLDDALLSTVALVAVLTMILTPFIATDRMAWSLMHLYPFRSSARLSWAPADHVLLLGCGPNIEPLLDRLVAGGQRVIVVDDDASVVRQLGDRGIEAVRGEGGDLDLLKTVGAHRARVLISTMRRIQDSERIIRHAAGRRVIVRVFSPEDATRIEAAGGVPVLYSAVGAEDFVRWFDREFPRG